MKGGKLIDVELPAATPTSSLATIDSSALGGDSLLQVLGIIGTEFGEFNNKINIVKTDYGIRTSASNIDEVTNMNISEMPTYVSSFSRYYYNKIQDELFSKNDATEPKNYPLVHLRNDKVGLPVSMRNGGEANVDVDTNADNEKYSDDLFSIRIGATLKLGDTVAERSSRVHDNVLLYFPPNSSAPNEIYGYDKSFRI